MVSITFVAATTASRRTLALLGARVGDRRRDRARELLDLHRDRQDEQRDHHLHHREALDVLRFRPRTAAAGRLWTWGRRHARPRSRSASGGSSKAPWGYRARQHPRSRRAGPSNGRMPTARRGCPAAGPSVGPPPRSPPGDKEPAPNRRTASRPTPWRSAPPWTKRPASTPSSLARGPAGWQGRPGDTASKPGGQKDQGGPDDQVAPGAVQAGAVDAVVLVRDVLDAEDHPRAGGEREAAHDVEDVVAGSAAGGDPGVVLLVARRELVSDRRRGSSAPRSPNRGPAPRSAGPPDRSGA